MQLLYPSMELVRSLDLFTAKEHINTVAVFDSASVWVVLHNLGEVCTPCTVHPQHRAALRQLMPLSQCLQLCAVTG